MAKFLDQTITFTYEELKILRDAIIAYESANDVDADTLYDKVEHGIHDSLGERIRVVREVCKDCEFHHTDKCPVVASNGADYECALREEKVEKLRG